MKKRSIRVVATVIAMLLGLTSCNSADASSQDQQQVEPQSGSGIEDTDGSTKRDDDAGSAQETQEDQPHYASEIFPTLPDDYDITDAAQVADFFISMLTSGGDGIANEDNIGARENPYDDPVNMTMEVYRIYQNSIFFGIPIKVTGMSLYESEYGTGGSDVYRLQLDIAESDSLYLLPGNQEWVLQLGVPDYFDFPGPVPLRLMHISKYQGWERAAEGDGPDGRLRLVIAMCAQGEFASPKELPVQGRATFLLINLSQDTTDGYYTRRDLSPITQAEADDWALRLFGQPLDPDGKHAFSEYGLYGPGGLDVYRPVTGGIPYVPDNFVYIWEDEDGIHRYYENYGEDIFWNGDLKSVPTGVMEYTVKDHIVWSGIDVTNQLVMSPYLDVMLGDTAYSTITPPTP